MRLAEQFPEQREFRIALLLPYSRMILVEHRDGIDQMPRLRISNRTRPAEQLSEALRAKWRIRSVVIDFLPQPRNLSRCVVIEVRSPNWKYAVDGLSGVRVSDLDEREVTVEERLALHSILAGDPQDRGPFSKLGWIEEAQEWIRERVTVHPVDFTEDVDRFSAGGHVALVRFGTHRGPAYWLKATSAPNAHEFVITQALACCCAAYVPPLVAARADWNAWVTEEVGRPLHDTLNLHSFVQSIHCLADLQIASATHIDTLLACGCNDQRLPILRAYFPELIRYLDDVMARQTSTKVRPLTNKQLMELGHLLEHACAAMETLGVPDTLIHNDINPGNILVDGTRAVFIDWSEAGIGSPFLTFQHLWVHASEAEETHTWASQLKNVYRRHWLAFLKEFQIERALALSPPLAIASYLLGRDPSFIAASRGDATVQSYARSLGRHMDRLARCQNFLEAL